MSTLKRKNTDGTWEVVLTDFSGSYDDLSDIPYATCATAAGTTAKVATCSGNFTLKTGSVIYVKFSNSNSASSPTLNVNGTGAKSIKQYGTTALPTYMWQEGSVVLFEYDGTNWIMVGGTTATTTYYGLTKLSNSTSSTSTTMAATPSAVKSAYDKANAAMPKSGGTFTGNIIAGSSYQAVGTSLLRNSKIVSVDTDPTVNGEICWTYA